MNALLVALAFACAPTSPNDGVTGDPSQLALTASDFLLEAKNGVDAQVFDTYNAANGTDQLSLYDSGWPYSPISLTPYKILVSVGSDHLVKAVRPYGSSSGITVPSGGYVLAVNGVDLPLLSSYVVGDELHVVPTSTCSPRSTGVPVLLYHDIGTSGDALEAHLLAIEKAGYNTITLDQLRDSLNGSSGENGCDDLPENPLVLTFDDAYTSQFAYAPALLNTYGMVGNFFVITSYPDSPTATWVASWSAISDAVDTYPDNVVLACHSHNAHYQTTVSGKLVARYMTMTAAERLADMVQCRDTLYDHTGVDTTALAWPFGSYDQSLTDVAYSAGFEMMLNTWPGINVEQNDDASGNVRRFGGSVTSTWSAIETPINRWYVCQ